jgi:hypothetical protein
MYISLITITSSQRVCHDMPAKVYYHNKDVMLFVVHYNAYIIAVIYLNVMYNMRMSVVRFWSHSPKKKENQWKN